MGKLDRAIAELERVQNEASELIDQYVDSLVARKPPGTSWGVTKYNNVSVGAGSQLNYLAALKQLKDRLLGS